MNLWRNRITTFVWIATCFLSIYQSNINLHVQSRLYDPNIKSLFKNTTPRKNYDEQQAIFMARLTSASYCKEKNIVAWNCTPCNAVHDIINVTTVHDSKFDFQGIVARHSVTNSILIAFRGSMDVQNWLDNLTFFKTTPYKSLYPAAEVHDGFYKVWKTVSSQVLDRVKYLQSDTPSAKVLVTGHSLGAAVSALCAFELVAIHKINVDSLWTFGKPRLGNSHWKAVFEASVPNHFRITHHRDVVPHVPTEWMGFVHSQQEIFYNLPCSHYTKCNDSIAESPVCSNSCSPLHCDSIADHVLYLNVSMSHLFC